MLLDYQIILIKNGKNYKKQYEKWAKIKEYLKQ